MHENGSLIGVAVWNAKDLSKLTRQDQGERREIDPEELVGRGPEAEGEPLVDRADYAPGEVDEAADDWLEAMRASAEGVGAEAGTM